MQAGVPASLSLTMEAQTVFVHANYIVNADLLKKDLARWECRTLQATVPTLALAVTALTALPDHGTAGLTNCVSPRTLRATPVMADSRWLPSRSSHCQERSPRGPHDGPT